MILSFFQKAKAYSEILFIIVFRRLDGGSTVRTDKSRQLHSRFMDFFQGPLF